MNARGSLATISLIAVAMGGCAAPTGLDDPPEEAPAPDEPLDFTVDSLDIVHGALRLSATMVDGAADVSVRVGGECEHREIGGGLSTRATLVWLLRDDDVAAVIPCGLVVRARVRDGAHFQNKVAALEVTSDVAPLDVDDGDDTPQLQALDTSEGGVGVAFAHVPRGARLATGDSLVDRAPTKPGEDDDVARFTIPHVDFARSVLRGWPLHLGGAAFAPSLSVGGASVPGEAQGSEVQDSDAGA